MPSSPHYETGRICNVCMYANYPIGRMSIPLLERMKKCVWTSRDHKADERICDAERLSAFPVVLCECGAPHHWHAQCVCHTNTCTIQSASWTVYRDTSSTSLSLLALFSIHTITSGTESRCSMIWKIINCLLTITLNADLKHFLLILVVIFNKSKTKRIKKMCS